MRICHSLAIALLALFSRVSAERLVRVIATIPNESLLANQSVIQPRQSNGADGNTRLFKDVEVTGFITKNGDLFEIAEPRSLGSVESRQEPEPGMSMCRYGTIVVYSDTDCNTFIKSSQNLGAPLKTEVENAESDVDEADEKPLKKKKKIKRNKRKPNKNKVKKRKRNNRRKNPVRRKVLKRGGNKNRRRNGSNQKRRRKNPPNRRRNQRRGNKKNVKKRRRVNNRD